MQVVLSTKRARAATQEILETHCIASDRSPDLQLDGTAAAANGTTDKDEREAAAAGGGAGGSSKAAADGSKAGG